MNLFQIAILALLFMSIVMAVMAVNSMLARRARMRSRLGLMAGSGSAATSDVDGETQGALQRLVAPMARFATPDNEADISRFQAKFYNAGIRSRAAPLYFFALKGLLAIGLPMLLWPALGFSGSGLSAQTTMMMLFISAALGYYLPNLALGTVVARRQRRLFEAFPDAIDLMVVCIEAGLTLDMAIQRAAKEMQIRSTDVADELALVGVEMRIGATRDRALRNLAARTGVSEIELFVAMILQADRFGTSIAASMRVHAEELRTRRQYRAEELATKMPTLLLFPLMLTIFPAMLVVLVGPAAIGLARQIVPMLTSGA